MKVSDVEKAVERAVARAVPAAVDAAFERVVERASDEATHRTMVIVEQLEGQIGAVVDALEATERRLNRRIDDLEARLTGRLEMLELAVKMLSDQVRKNSSDIERLVLEVAQVRESLHAHATREELLKLEARVEELEARAGIASKPD